MANMGASVTLTDPIYAIEVTYGDGSKRVKTYPSRGGFGSGLAATKRDIEHWKLPRYAHLSAARSWVPVSVRTLICDPTWKDFTP